MQNCILKVVYYFECKLVILNAKNCHPELVSGSYNKILNQGRNEDEQGWTAELKNLCQK